MSDDNITRFPISAYQRRRNMQGPLHVECYVSGRWLQFGETSSPAGGGDIVWLDVMTQDEDKPAHKICSLAITVQNLKHALEAIKTE